MNSVTRHHYPASKLPSDLRRGIDPSDIVTVTIVVENAEAGEWLSLDQILALSRAPDRTIEQIDTDVRRDRDAWDR